jgi:hypothetical protein
VEERCGEKEKHKGDGCREGGDVLPEIVIADVGLEFGHDKCVFFSALLETLKPGLLNILYNSAGPWLSLQWPRVYAYHVWPVALGLGGPIDWSVHTRIFLAPIRPPFQGILLHPFNPVSSYYS